MRIKQVNFIPFLLRANDDMKKIKELYKTIPDISFHLEGN